MADVLGPDFANSVLNCVFKLSLFFFAPNG